MNADPEYSSMIYEDIMLDKCWKENPEERSSFRELLPLLQELSSLDPPSNRTST